MEVQVFHHTLFPFVVGSGQNGFVEPVIEVRGYLVSMGGRDVASEKSRRCHLQQPPGPPPTSTAVFCVY